jgi:predicted ATPase
MIISAMASAADSMVGRDSEVAVVDAFLEEATTAFVLLRIEGEPGIGKTTVWRTALRRATAGGARVLLTRPTQAEAALSFASLADLFGAACQPMLSGCTCSRHTPVTSSSWAAAVAP